MPGPCRRDTGARGVAPARGVCGRSTGRGRGSSGPAAPLSSQATNPPCCHPDGPLSPGGSGPPPARPRRWLWQSGRRGRAAVAAPPSRPLVRSPLRGRNLRRRSGGTGPPGGREEVSGAGTGAGGGPHPRRPPPQACRARRRSAGGFSAAPCRGGGLRAGSGGPGDVGSPSRSGSGTWAGCGPAAGSREGSPGAWRRRGAEAPSPRGGRGLEALPRLWPGRDGGGCGGHRPGGGVVALVTGDGGCRCSWRCRPGPGPRQAPPG